MPDTVKCPTCNGSGKVEALESQHDDKKVTVTCWTCHGKGVIHPMTDKEEEDYWDNYW